MTKLIAVIPTWNREDMLERCIETLRRHTPVDDIIIVRGKYPTAHARNVGIAQVPDDSIIFSIDDDCWYDADINLQETIEEMDNLTGVVQTTRIMPGMKRAKNKRMLPVPLCWIGAGLLFRKSVWLEVGGYPHDYLDDVMLSAVVYAHGFKNYRSTLSYGHHEVDTKRGGMFEVIKTFGEQGFYSCEPDKYLVAGDPCVSKQAILNIKNIRPTSQLRALHKLRNEGRI